MAPDRPGTEDWKTKEEILRRALDWLTNQANLDDLNARRIGMRKLIER